MIYLAFDLHIGYGWTPGQYGRVWRFQQLPTPSDTVIYGGDTYEYAWRRKEDVQQSKEYERFEASRVSKSRLLDGNHDMGGLDISYKHWIIDSIEVMHGHQYDSLSDSAWKRWFYSIAPLAKDIWFKSPFQQKQNGDTNWQNHNLFVLGNAIKAVESNPDITTLVIGHVHDSYKWFRHYSKKVVICVGSLPEDGVYATYDGEVRIHSI